MLIKEEFYIIKIMFIEFSMFLFVATFKIVHCEDPNLPEGYIPDRGAKPLLRQNPPKKGKKFSLPQCCQNASEWEDVDLSLQILTNYTEPIPERSSFASLINLIKFILIKEELSDLNLPQGYIPDRGAKLSLPQNPPKLPLLHLSGKKFSLPQCCQNASEWEDVDLSLQILTDYTEPVPDRSIFASLINLIKFILIKEKLSGIDVMKDPIIQGKRPEGQVFKASLENNQILKKIETALANKPKHRAQPIEFYDNIDISNMIPIWRPRGNNRRIQAKTAPAAKEIKVNGTSVANPIMTKSFAPGLAVFSDNLNSVSKEAASKSACQSKAPTLTLFMAAPPNCKLQSLPSTNIKPVVVGCGGNCNLCQKLANPVLAGCPRLASTAVLSGCPKTYMGLGCPYSNMIGCPKCANILPGYQGNQQALRVLQPGTIPLRNCFGNLMKKVTTTVLVPVTVSQFAC